MALRATRLATSKKGYPNMSAETISYAFAETSVGRLLVGMSEAGVVWVSVGRSDTSMLDSMTRRFPRAEFVLADARRGRWVEAVAASVEDPKRPRKVALDLRGTEFQRAVWAAMREIPVGETRSYSDMARAAGRPRAWRAAASACRANPVMIVVPCHRVISADGGLGGYGGNLPLKRKLLEREGAL